MKKSFILNFPIVPIFILTILINTSCEQDSGPLIIEPPGAEPVSYSLEIQPIFNVSCAGCHDEFHQHLDLRSCCSYDQLLILGTNAPYVDPDNPAQSKLYRHLTGELLQMPLFGPLPDHEINLVLRWITEGGNDN